MLSEGSIRKIIDGEQITSPVLQILEYKNIGTSEPGGHERFRLALFDGVDVHKYCVIASVNLVERLKSGEIGKRTVIRLLEYSCNQLQGKHIIVIQDVEVVAADNRIHNTVPKSTLNQSNQSPGGRKRTFNDSFNDSFNLNDVSINTLNCIPITALNPYQSRWTVRGRVTAKTGLRNWNKISRQGKLFSFNIQDSSGEIKIIAFNDECDKFIDVIEVNKVYLISKGSIKSAGKSTILKHDFEVSLTADSIVERIDDDLNCPQIQFNFMKIADIGDVAANTYVDVLAICEEIGEINRITIKSTGKQKTKQDILLIDDSDTEINLTIWEENANFAIREGSVVAVRRARVDNFNGKCLNLTNDSALMIDPEIPEDNQIKEWFNSRRSDLANVSTLSNFAGRSTQNLNFKVLCDVIKSPLFYVTKCLILTVGNINFYQTCPDGCKKKLIDLNDGTYRCDTCKKNHTNYNMKMIVKLCISDCSRDRWVTVFNDEAEQLLNIKAKQLNQLKQMGSPEYDHLIHALNLKSFVFRLKAEEEHYNQELRPKITVMAISPVNIVDYSRKLIDTIKMMRNN